MNQFILFVLVMGCGEAVAVDGVKGTLNAQSI